MYWGKYVQHDNNRDGMGQFLELTKAVTRSAAQWHPTVMHDLHEAQTYLYSSTGTGPYNDALDPIVDRRVVAARAERRHRDDQARRARRVDLRVLRRLGAELHVLHRPLAQRDRPLLRSAELRPRQLRGAARRDVTSKEWFRPNPPLPFIKWGPRNNTNIQQSGVLFSLQPRREEPRDLSRELLAEEQALDRRGRRRPDQRVGHPGRRSAARPTPPTRSTS